ncbi:uncharacterized protein LOC104868717 [Fukomys damarensis]|uniref:uncharacterized protein LOC104868717 n=1 Tax=Fukomys damarensis TaxID=885580 RepID=UPI00053F40CB|nr:uncharacterized protein LOC104868717 [Fukomys damarensis]
MDSVQDIAYAEKDMASILSTEPHKSDAVWLSWYWTQWKTERVAIDSSGQTWEAVGLRLRVMSPEFTSTNRATKNYFVARVNGSGSRKSWKSHSRYGRFVSSVWGSGTLGANHHHHRHRHCRGDREALCEETAEKHERAHAGARALDGSIGHLLGRLSPQAAGILTDTKRDTNLASSFLLVTYKMGLLGPNNQPAGLGSVHTVILFSLVGADSFSWLEQAAV